VTVRRCTVGEVAGTDQGQPAPSHGSVLSCSASGCQRNRFKGPN
jgi:hypothetical protein